MTPISQINILIVLAILSTSVYSAEDMPTIELIEEDMYCPNHAQLSKPSKFDLEKCAEIVTLSKGKNGCHTSNGLFMHSGEDSGYCYCVTDDCTQRQSTLTNRGSNLYKISEVTSIKLFEEDMNCPNHVQLRSRSNSLKACAEVVSMSKGKNGCHPTYDIFMHDGTDSGYCYCIKDECRVRSPSSTGLNIYEFTKRTCEAKHAKDSKQCLALRLQDYVVIMNRPCKIVELSTKTGKDGQSEVHFSGLDIFSGILLKDNCSSNDSRDVPNIKRKDYKLLLLEDGILTLEDADTYEIREDLRIPVFTDIARVIQKAIDNDAPLLCTVLSACEEEAVVGTKIDYGNLY